MDLEVQYKKIRKNSYFSLYIRVAPIRSTHNSYEKYEKNFFPQTPKKIA